VALVAVLLTLFVEPIRVWEAAKVERLLNHGAAKESEPQPAVPKNPPTEAVPKPPAPSTISSPGAGDNGTIIENQGGQNNHQNSPDNSHHIGTQNNESRHK